MSGLDNTSFGVGVLIKDALIRHPLEIEGRKMPAEDELRKRDTDCRRVHIPVSRETAGDIEVGKPIIPPPMITMSEFMLYAIKAWIHAPATSPFRSKGLFLQAPPI